MAGSLSDTQLVADGGQGPALQPRAALVKAVTAPRLLLAEQKNSQ